MNHLINIFAALLLMPCCITCASYLDPDKDPGGGASALINDVVYKASYVPSFAKAYLRSHRDSGLSESDFFSLKISSEIRFRNFTDWDDVLYHLTFIDFYSETPFEEGMTFDIFNEQCTSKINHPTVGFDRYYSACEVLGGTVTIEDIDLTNMKLRLSFSLDAKKDNNLIKVRNGIIAMSIMENTMQ